ncbi:MAG: hypothetical protein HQK51_19410 [Oligoflexia bacterium]|nr:hypothetical protein [Oligoflexia bacterium]
MIPKITSNNSSPYKKPFEENEEKKQKKNQNGSDKKHKDPDEGLIVSISPSSKSRGQMLDYPLDHQIVNHHKDNDNNNDEINYILTKMNNHQFYKNKGIVFSLVNNSTEDEHYDNHDDHNVHEDPRALTQINILKKDSGQFIQRISIEQFRALVQRIDKGYHESSLGDLVNVKC